MSNRRKLRPKVHDMPPSVSRLVDRLMQADAEWFRRNPGQTVCTRSVVAGEAWPFQPSQGSRVTVTLIAPHLRMRRFSDGTEVIDVDASAPVQVTA
jgi:hypothetical protein